MRFNYYLFFLFIFLFACETNSPKIKIKIKPEIKEPEIDKGKIIQKSEIKIKNEIINIVYSNKGFAFIYDEKKNNFLNIKLDNSSIKILSPNLPGGTPVRITNIINGKEIITIVKEKVNLPKFYNSVITKRVVDELSINPKEPYIYIETISSDKLYVASNVKTYDEEKEVANKAPVDDIMVQSISLETEVKISKNQNDISNFNYIIKFADLYFEDSAIMLKKRLFEEYNIKDILIKKLSQNNFRVYKGPYNDFEKLKKGFHNMENLDFDSIEIIKL